MGKRDNFLNFLQKLVLYFDGGPQYNLWYPVASKTEAVFSI